MYFFLYTTSGLQLGIMLAAMIIPGKLSIQSIDGQLLSSFSLRNVTYQTGEEKITIQSLDFSWQPKELLNKKFDIVNIAIGDTLIEQSLTPLYPDQSFSFLKRADFVLNHININQFSFRQFIIKKNNQIIAQANSGLISYKNQILQIQHADISIQDAHLTLNGTLTNNWDLHYTLHIPNLGSIQKNYSGSILSSGSITGPRLTPVINLIFDAKNITLADEKFKTLQGQASISLQPNILSTVNIATAGLKIKNYTLTRLNLNLTEKFTYENKTLKTKLNLSIEKRPGIDMQFIFPKFDLSKIETQTFSGTITWKDSNLSFLNSFVKEIKSPQGVLEAQFKMNGSLSEPKIQGRFTLNNGSFSIPHAGVTLKNIHLTINADRENQLKLTGGFQSGEGSAQLQGQINLSQTHFPATFTLKGKDLTAVNLAHYKIKISPDLIFTYYNQLLNLEGTITVPEANITPTNFNDSINMSDDVVYVSSNNRNPVNENINFNPLFNFNMQINLILGDDTFIQYKDLETSLGGHLTITATPGNSATATGELYSIKGTYRAYGQKLTIDDGRLIYAGNILSNPGLNIRAMREIQVTSMGGTSSFTNTHPLQPIYTGRETLTVGVQINGTMYNPLISLFSKPSGMNQGDILSCLLLGYPQSLATGPQLGALLTATSALNSSGKTHHLSHLTEGLQKTLGLSEVSVGSTEIFDPTSGKTTATTSFMVGKQLSNKLYLHYSIGLFNAVSILNLKYQLTKRWAIQSETSTIDSGADLLYAFERD